MPFARVGAGFQQALNNGRGGKSGDQRRDGLL
jgi:hypothetical protein